MEVKPPMETILAADIGGTKCELAVFSLEGDDYQPLAFSRYPSRQFGGIDEIIALFLKETGFHPECACLGVAGVTGRDTATVTNLPWIIDSGRLADTFGFSRVALLNDMTSVCASIAILGEQDWVELQPGDGEGGEMAAVIAPGTGLGEGLLFRSAEVFFPRGCEGGHADFAPVDEEQEELLRWMLRRGGPVSYEDLIAGPGIPYLYEFLLQSCRAAESSDVHAQLRDAADRTPIIVDAAIRDLPCPLCRRTVELFLAILGSEAGNLALKLYAKGGVYVGGGIVPRLVGRLPFTGFLDNFRRKGKMENLMASFPVRLITRRSAALLGVARYGRVAFAGSSGRK
jgi:glucokinase